MVLAVALLMLTGARFSPPVTVIAKHSLSPGLRVELVGVVTPAEYRGPSTKTDMLLRVQKRLGRRWGTIATERVSHDGNDGGEEVAYRVADFDGDGRFEIAVSATILEAVRVESEVFVFRWDGRRIHRLGHVGGDEGSTMGDLRHDGGFAIRVWNDVAQSGHAAWPDHYVVRGDRLIRANPSFPRTYADVRRALLSHYLPRAPWDDFLWVAYGKALRLARLRETPKHAYGRVIRLAQALLKRAPYDPNDMVAKGIGYLKESIRNNEPFPRPGKWMGDGPTGFEPAVAPR